MIKAVRGTRDLLPPETALWNFVEAAARDIFRAYNFQEIRTPIFEETQLFARSVGEETDIVSKEMYTWEDGTEPADYALYEEWLIRRYPGIGTLERMGPDFSKRKVFGPTLRVHPKGKTSPTVVRFSHRATFQDVHNLTEARERGTGHPSGKPQLLLVTLSATLSESVRAFAKQEGVEIEELTLKDFAPPQSLTLRPENTA